MAIYILTDNSKLNNISSSDKLLNHPIITKIKNKDLSVLEKDGLLIFPNHISESADLEKENYIFEQKNNELWTKNIVGFLGDGNDEIIIQSRFTQSKSQDYFLRYMIQTVLNYNVAKSKIGLSKEAGYYELLIYLFPYYLNAAMRKGLYKEYVKRSYNDANIRGPINFASHIKANVPFRGNVAYSTREFSYDNNMTELIRHTIEKIKVEKPFVLSKDEEIRRNCREIVQATITYARINRSKIIQNNILYKAKHGYFSEYSALQELCIQILADRKVSFSSNEQKIHGIVIDVAWLWEEYIYKITDWKHYGRDKSLKTLNLYSKVIDGLQQHRYPDFVDLNIPIDTKYKKKIKRDDYNQLTTYIHILKAELGGFLQPTDNNAESGYKVLGELNGGGKMFTFKFFIPQACESYEAFVDQIKLSEEMLVNFHSNELTI